jgi:hypothetical protein
MSRFEKTCPNNINMRNFGTQGRQHILNFFLLFWSLLYSINTQIVWTAHVYPTSDTCLMFANGQNLWLLNNIIIWKHLKIFNFLIEGKIILLSCRMDDPNLYSDAKTCKGFWSRSCTHRLEFNCVESKIIWFQNPKKSVEKYQSNNRNIDLKY